MGERSVLVVGATGYLGRYVVQQALAAGWKVRALVRDASRLEIDGVEVFQGQVTDPPTLDGLVDGIDVVFSSLGITRQADGVTYDDVDFGGNKAVLDRAVEAGCRRFVYTSVLHPEYTVHTDMVGAKERFVAALEQAPIESVVVRPTGFFSDMGEFLDMARSGRVYVFGDGSNELNPIHGEDLAKVCVQAFDGPTGDVPIGGPDVLSQRQIGELAFAALDRPARITGVPLWLVDLTLFLVKPFSRRWWNIGSFMAGAGRHTMVAPSTGEHRLAEWFAEEAR